MLLIKPVQRNRLHFFLNLLNTVHDLRVNETKVTLGNSLIADLFTLECQKSKIEIWQKNTILALSEES